MLYGIYDGENESNTKCYIVWQSMIQRCYSPNNKNKKKTYKDCTVCEEWLTYSNFKKWFEENYQEGYALDKDLLYTGNRIYSPETCCFIPNEINTSLITRQSKKTNLPTGVSYDVSGKFQVILRKYGKSKRLGTFYKLSTAYQVYCDAKETYIKELAIQYYNDGKINEKVFHALNNYKVKKENFDEIVLKQHMNLGKTVYQYDTNNHIINIFSSIREAGRFFGENKQTAIKSISNCCNNKCKTYKGYIWSFNKLK